MFSIVNEDELRRILAQMLLDEHEFLGPHGIRALSRCHLDFPFGFRHRDQEFGVSYLPVDSDSGMSGSRWVSHEWDMTPPESGRRATSPSTCRDAG